MSGETTWPSREVTLPEGRNRDARTGHKKPAPKGRPIRHESQAESPEARHLPGCASGLTPHFARVNAVRVGTATHGRLAHTSYSLYSADMISSRAVIRVLKANGWVLTNVEGSHHQFVHPTKPGRVTVPHPKKDLAKFLLKSIERQSGLKLLK